MPSFKVTMSNHGGREVVVIVNEAANGWSALHVAVRSIVMHNALPIENVENVEIEKTVHTFVVDAAE